MQNRPVRRRVFEISLLLALGGCETTPASSTGESTQAGDAGPAGGAPGAEPDAARASGGTGGGGAVVDENTAGAGGTGGTGGEAPATAEPDAGAPPTSATIDGDLTWTVRFDATAQRQGAVDCTYTRHYAGVQMIPEPWACPTCERMFRAQVEMTEGLEDCFSQVSGNPPAAEESIAYGNGTFWRGSSSGFVGPFGTTGRALDGFTSYWSLDDNPVAIGGTANFVVRGTFTIGEQPGDPIQEPPLVPPDTYACGWPKAAPPPYVGPYTANDGDVLPDGVFLDKCGEPVRLHDFAGRYLVVDMSAYDCPPCRQMAAQENDFIARLAADGLEVEVITLMAPSLADPLGETSTRLLADWTRFNDLESPVLADRGWGQAMFVPLFGEDAGYPSMAVVAPDLTIIGSMSGYDEYVTPESLIRAHAMVSP